MLFDPKTAKFETNIELFDLLKKLVPDDPDALVDITGTPAESIWPADISYNGENCVSLAFGPSERTTPWGYMPMKIYFLKAKYAGLVFDEEALMKDLEKRSAPKKEEKKFTLFPPGWKPAPGFTDPRKDWN